MLILTSLCFLSFLSFFNTAPPYSLKYNSQRLNRRNRELVLVTNWSKDLILIKDCRDYARGDRAPEEEMHTEACIKQSNRTRNSTNKTWQNKTKKQKRKVPKRWAHTMWYRETANDLVRSIRIRVRPYRNWPARARGHPVTIATAFNVEKHKTYKQHKCRNTATQRTLWATRAATRSDRSPTAEHRAHIRQNEQQLSRNRSSRRAVKAHYTRHSSPFEALVFPHPPKTCYTDSSFVFDSNLCMLLTYRAIFLYVYSNVAIQRQIWYYCDPS